MPIGIYCIYYAMKNLIVLPELRSECYILNMYKVLQSNRQKNGLILADK